MKVDGPIFFPPFRLDLAEQRLYRESVIPLRPKTYAVLRYLLERAGKTVSKNELLDAVWPDTAVGDSVLKVSINELREKLGDDAESPRFILTEARKGYRFIGAIRRSNLPAQLTSFVGREREIEEVSRRLASTRLLTLTGTGGSGKTRLAVEVANALVETQGEQVWWVELASLADESLVPQAVASALGVPEQPGRTLTQTVCEHLRSARLTLVLDNCEHLVESCATLAVALLRSCPALKILATSREALGVKGETPWLIPPLSLPDRRRLPPAEELEQYEGLRLFEERGRAALPGFVLTERDREAASQVCIRLDGLPLAIELAAARLKVLTVQQIAARLDDRFRLLTTGGRTEPAPSPDVGRSDRLELRPADSQRADPRAPAIHLRRWLDPPGCRSDLRGRRCRAGRDPRPPVTPRRQVPGRLWRWGRRGSATPSAGNNSAICAAEVGRLR